MKTIACGLMAVLLLLVSCAGNAARQTANLPAMRAAWATIKVEATREAEATSSAEGLADVALADAAMVSGSPQAIASAPWSSVEQLATADIDRRLAMELIGPGVADSLREELRLFATSRAVFTRTPR